MHLPSLARSTSRRSPRTDLTAVVVAASLVIAGCSSDDDNGDTTSGTSASADSNADSGADASEVTISHVYGEDTYPTNPETVVAIGTAVDNLLALGITPDAIVERPDDKDAAWKNDQLEDVERIPLSDQNVPLEEIAALEPDLVVGDLYRIPEEAYDALKDVSPVLPGIDQTADWEPQLKALGQIYGKQDEAQQVIDDDEQAFADVREELPGLEGKTALTVQDRGGQFGVIAGYDKLPQVESGAVVEDDKSVMAALNIPSSLSNAWLLNTIKDQLKTAAEA